MATQNATGSQSGSGDVVPVRSSLFWGLIDEASNTSFRSQFDDEQQALFVDDALVFAPLTIASVVLALYLLYRARWHPRNLLVVVGLWKAVGGAAPGEGHWVGVSSDGRGERSRRADTPGCLTRCAVGCCPVWRRVSICTFLARVCLFIPALLIGVWGTVVAANVIPLMAGLTMLTTWPAFLLFLVGVLLLRQRNFRMASRKKRGWGLVHWLFGIGACLVVVYECCVVLLADYDFVGASWTALSINMLIVCRVVSDIQLVPYEDTMDGLLLSGLALKKRVRRQVVSDGELSAMGGGDGASGVGSSVVTGKGGRMYRGHSQKSLQSVVSVGTGLGSAASVGMTSMNSFALAAVNAHAKVVEEERLRRLQAREHETAPARMYQYLSANYLYGAALGVLLVFAMVHWPNTTSLTGPSAGSGTAKVLGFVIMAAVFLLDMCLFVLHRARFLKSPVQLLSVMALSRAVMVMFGSEWWLLGFTAVYVVFTATVGRLAVSELVTLMVGRDEEITDEGLRRSDLEDAELGEVVSGDDEEEGGGFGGRIELLKMDVARGPRGGSDKSLDIIAEAEAEASRRTSFRSSRRSSRGDDAASQRTELQDVEIANIGDETTDAGEIESQDVTVKGSAGSSEMRAAISTLSSPADGDSKRGDSGGGPPGDAPSSADGDGIRGDPGGASEVKGVEDVASGSRVAVSVTATAIDGKMTDTASLDSKEAPASISRPPRRAGHNRRPSHESGAGQSSVSRGSARGSRRGMKHRRRRERSKKFHSHVHARSAPAVVFSIVTVAFGALVGAIWYADAPLAAVGSVEDEHPQYEFGLAGLLVTVVYTAFLGVYRVAFRESPMKTWTKRSVRLTIAAFVGAYLCAIAAGVTLQNITGSDLTLAVPLFGVPAVACAAYVLKEWKRADFDYWVTLDDEREIKARRAAAGKDDGSDGSVSGPSSHSGLTRGKSFMRTAAHRVGVTRRRLRNLLVALCTFIAFACTVGFAVFLIVRESFSAAWIPLTLAMAPALLLFTYLPIAAWFNTLKFSVFQLITGIIALLLLVGMHVLILLGNADVEHGPEGAMVSMLLYMFVTVLVSSVYKLRDDGWQASRGVAIGAAIGTVGIVGCLASAGFLMLSTTAGIGALVLWCLAALTLAVLSKWVHDGFYLRPLLRYPVYLILAVAMVGGLTMAAIVFFQGGDNATVMSLSWFTFSWSVVVVALLVAAWPTLSRGAKGHHIFYSSTVFPAFVYDPHNDTMEPGSRGAAYLLVAVVMVFVWGMFATLFVAPYRMGLVAMSSSMVIGSILVCDFSRRSELAFAHAVNELRKSHDENRLADVLRDALAMAKEWLDDLRGQNGRSVATTMIRKLRAQRHRMRRQGDDRASRAASKSTFAFAEIFISRALLDRETALLKKVKRLLAQGVPSYSRDASSKSKIYAVEEGDEVGEDGKAVPRAPSPDHVPRGQFVHGIDPVEDSKRGVPGLVSLRPVFAELDMVQKAIDVAWAEEAQFRSLLHRRVVEAAEHEQAREKEAWVAFLRWCAAPAQEFLLHNYGLQSLGRMAARIKRGDRSRNVFYSQHAAEQVWRHRYGRKQSIRLGARLENLRALHDQVLEEQDAINAARRRQGERAELHRMEAVRQQRYQARDGPASVIGSVAGSVVGTPATGRRAPMVGTTDFGDQHSSFGSLRSAGETGNFAATLDGGGAVNDELIIADGEVDFDGDGVGDGLGDGAIEAEIAALVDQQGGGYYFDKWHGNKTLGDPRLTAIVNGCFARARDMSRGKPPEVIVDSADPRDVRQGALGDCYLLSAMSVVAQRKDLIDHVLVTEQGNTHGIYAVRLFKNGRWERVIIDDRFPAFPNEHVNGAGERKQGSYTLGTPEAPRYALPVFSHSEVPNEFWLMIIEKAFAKYHGSYAAIEGGLVHHAMVDLTGGAAEFHDLRSSETKAAVESGSMWARLLSYARNGYLIAAGTPAGDDSSINEVGIVQGHAYAVLRVEEVADTRGSHQLLQLRNPWGHGEWNGDWSDRDTKRWTKRMCAKLGHDVSGTSADDDGLFWMSFHDFVLNFSDLYVCRVPKIVKDGGQWHKYTARGQWRGTTAAGSTKNPGAENNPQFWIRPRTACRCFVSLTQHEKPGKPLVPIGLYVLKKKGLRAASRRSGETVAVAKYSNTREVTVEFELTPKAEPYTLFVSTYSRGQEADFRVTLYSDAPLDTGAGRSAELEKIPPTVGAA